MKERFKVRQIKDGIIHYGEIEAEEAFRYRGLRYFLHQYRCGEKNEWRVSCVMSGGAIGWGPFREDAIRLAKKKLYFAYTKYMSSLRLRDRATWRPNKEEDKPHEDTQSE